MAEIEKLLKVVDEHLRTAERTVEKLKAERWCYCPVCFDVDRRGSEGRLCICGKGKYVTIDDIYVEKFRKAFSAYGKVIEKVIEVFKAVAKAMIITEGKFEIEFGLKTMPNKLIVFLGKRPELNVELVLFSVNLKILRALIDKLKKIVNEISLEFPETILRVRVFPSAYRDEVFRALREFGFEEKKTINSVEFVWTS